MLLLVVFSHLLYAAQCMPFYEKLEDLGHNMIRKRPSTNTPITDCVFMTSAEGDYYYKSAGDKTTCGVYVIAEAEKRVEIVFKNFDVSCSSGGLVSVVDGWELNSQYYPSVQDHPKQFSHRFHELCTEEQKPHKAYFSSQNVAMIQYRIPAKGEGFHISVRFLINPSPCNVLLQSYEGFYTLRNYGKRDNCTVSILFPSRIQVLSLNVGVQPPLTETGINKKCVKREGSDFVEIIGADGLDPTDAFPQASVCGLDSNPKDFMMKLFCGTTAIRLVSSGNYENSVTVEFNRLTIDDLADDTFVCG